MHSFIILFYEHLIPLLIYYLKSSQETLIHIWTSLILSLLKNIVMLLEVCLYDSLLNTDETHTKFGLMATVMTVATMTSQKGTWVTEVGLIEGE